MTAITGSHAAEVQRCDSVFESNRPRINHCEAIIVLRLLGLNADVATLTAALDRLGITDAGGWMDILDFVLLLNHLREHKTVASDLRLNVDPAVDRLPLVDDEIRDIFRLLHSPDTGLLGARRLRDFLVDPADGMPGSDVDAMLRDAGIAPDSCLTFEEFFMFMIPSTEK